MGEGKRQGERCRARMEVSAALNWEHNCDANAAIVTALVHVEIGLLTRASCVILPFDDLISDEAQERARRSPHCCEPPDLRRVFRGAAEKSRNTANRFNEVA